MKSTMVLQQYTNPFQPHITSRAHTLLYGHEETVEDSYLELNKFVLYLDEAPSRVQGVTVNELRLLNWNFSNTTQTRMFHSCQTNVYSTTLCFYLNNYTILLPGFPY